MKFRIILKSFNNKLIDLASQKLRSILVKTDCTLKGAVLLPTKIKRFCVLRSPHVDKNSREHFEIRLYKRFIDLTIISSNALDILLKIELPAGILCSLKILEKN
jgi:small subunit ribosomal protein S10